MENEPESISRKDKNIYSNSAWLTFPYHDTTWIDTNTGITPHGVPDEMGHIPRLEPDAEGFDPGLFGKDGERKTAFQL